MFYLGPYEYNSKEQLKVKLRRYLAQTNDGRITHPILIDKLKYLLLLHPDHDRKSGSGVVGFEVGKNKLGSGAGFLVCRVDGSKERFSYKKCIDGITVTKRSKAIEAFRFLTRQQMRSYRGSVRLPIKCAISGRQIETNGDMEIDHRPEFSELLREFCAIKNIKLEALETSGGGEKLKLTNKLLADEFTNYHAEHAILRPVLKSAHHAAKI